MTAKEAHKAFTQAIIWLEDNSDYTLVDLMGEKLTTINYWLHLRANAEKIFLTGAESRSTLQADTASGGKQ